MGKMLHIALVAVGGFIAGVLLAPKSGEDTRKDLKVKAKEYQAKSKAGMDEMKKGAGAVKEELKSGADSLKDIAKDASVDAKRTAERVKEEAAARAKVIKEEIRQTGDDARNATK